MSALKISEAFCYICRSVLIKPITLPCRHGFCFNCFEDSMQETSYSCPLCRRRVSNWVRKARKRNSLVNEKLWEKIIKQFRTEVNLKLRGEDDGLDERLKEEEGSPSPFPVAEPGELAEEYSKMMNEYQAEREKLAAAEELASRQLISQLTEEEELEIEAMKRDKSMKMAMDEQYAKKLHKELNKNAAMSSSRKSSSNQRHKKKKIRGPMDNFLKKAMDMKIRSGLKLRLQERLGNRCASTDSTDSIQAEMHHFKPIKIVPRTPPKRNPDGKILEIAVTEVKPVKASNVQNGITSYQSSNNLTSSKKIHSPYSAFIGKGVPYRDPETAESSRKRQRPAEECESGGVLKEITIGENSGINSIGLLADGEDSSKRKRNSPLTSRMTIAIKKALKNDLANTKIVAVDPDEASPEEDENSDENENSDSQQTYDSDDYLDSDTSTEPDVVEEQKRIEQLILQEKEDRELAVKLSREWEGRYELRKKPKQKQAAVKKKSKNIVKKRCTQSLLCSMIFNKGKK